MNDIAPYNVTAHPWFSPKQVLIAYANLYKHYKKNINKREFKRAREMYLTSIGLLGVYELNHSNKYWLQSNQESSSPDVMAATQLERENDSILLLLNQIELVEFEDHYKNNDLFDFMNNTKLKKHYDENFLILCFVNRIVNIDIKELSRKLISISPKSHIYICGHSQTGSDNTFKIFSPYPRLTKVVEYDIVKTAESYFLPPQTRFNRSLNQKITYEKESQEILSLYDLFTLDEDLIKSKYGS